MERVLNHVMDILEEKGIRIVPCIDMVDDKYVKFVGVVANAGINIHVLLHDGFTVWLCMGDKASAFIDRCVEHGEDVEGIEGFNIDNILWTGKDYEMAVTIVTMKEVI